MISLWKRLCFDEYKKCFYNKIYCLPLPFGNGITKKHLSLSSYELRRGAKKWLAFSSKHLPGGMVTR